MIKVAAVALVRSNVCELSTEVEFITSLSCAPIIQSPLVLPSPTLVSYVTSGV
jgi:hypothetical protein